MYLLCHSCESRNPVIFNVIPQLDCRISGHSLLYKIGVKSQYNSKKDWIPASPRV
ncbi:hypothetical protein BTU51_1481 [Rickettsia rickettsii]|uniref:Uncharacterized protein n=1 Tax=Rickettsia rickettsii (strain Iowa) TaxID=452659 RepID=B0BVE2_RICRO|nr:hypothetical protein RrIowa_1481 [Rickettsia rickettsii str. Iowa]APU56151.1 hypothetical protein BTU50_1481 [Rickettsia rickettsii]APU57528.1 hypothetical protein BTU51_1481 [Rickettsia rickettsii]